MYQALFFPSRAKETKKQKKKEKCLGPRNDVLTTCTAVILRCGQRIIALFPNSKHFLDFLEARSEPAEEIRNA